MNDGSCVRLRPEHKDHVWSYDFVHARTRDGRAFRMLAVLDEFTRECLAIDVARRLSSDDVLERLSDLFVRRGVPARIRSDNRPEFTAKAVREWLGRVGVTTLYIEPGSPWENGYHKGNRPHYSIHYFGGQVLRLDHERRQKLGVDVLAIPKRQCQFVIGLDIVRSGYGSSYQALSSVGINPTIPAPW